MRTQPRFKMSPPNPQPQVGNSEFQYDSPTSNQTFMYFYLKPKRCSLRVLSFEHLPQHDITSSSCFCMEIYNTLKPLKQPPHKFQSRSRVNVQCPRFSQPSSRTLSTTVRQRELYKPSIGKTKQCRQDKWLAVLIGNRNCVSGGKAKQTHTTQ